MMIWNGKIINWINKVSTVFSCQKRFLQSKFRIEIFNGFCVYFGTTKTKQQFDSLSVNWIRPAKVIWLDCEMINLHPNRICHQISTMMMIHKWILWQHRHRNQMQKKSKPHTMQKSCINENIRIVSMLYEYDDKCVSASVRMCDWVSEKVIVRASVHQMKQTAF